MISGRMRVGMPSCSSIGRAQSRLRGSYIWLVDAIENSALRTPVKRKLNRSGMNSSVSAMSSACELASRMAMSW
jgi:hypothetical protein